MCCARRTVPCTAGRHRVHEGHHARLQVARKLHVGIVWASCTNSLHENVPFGGYKQSGIGRKLGEYALNK